MNKKKQNYIKKKFINKKILNTKKNTKKIVFSNCYKLKKG